MSSQASSAGGGEAKVCQKLIETGYVDARNVYRKVTRKIYDFSPEQRKNITSIV
jgi:type I restriction enzyme M protein